MGDRSKHPHVTSCCKRIARRLLLECNWPTLGSCRNAAHRAPCGLRDPLSCSRPDQDVSQTAARIASYRAADRGCVATVPARLWVNRFGMSARAVFLGQEAANPCFCTGAAEDLFSGGRPPMNADQHGWKQTLFIGVDRCSSAAIIRLLTAQPRRRWLVPSGLRPCRPLPT